MGPPEFTRPESPSAVMSPFQVAASQPASGPGGYSPAGWSSASSDQKAREARVKAMPRRRVA